MSLVIDEYLAADKKPEHRTLKILVSILAGLLVVFCAVFSGSQTARELRTSSAAPTTSAATISSAQTTESGTSDRRAADSAQASTVQRASTTPEIRATETVSPVWEKFSRQDRFQIWTTALAICVGLALFLIFKWEEPSMQAELDSYQSKTDVAASVLGSKLTVPGGNP